MHSSPAPEDCIHADLLRVPVGPGAIHVERYGHGGPAVVLVHGFPTCSFLWREIAPAIAAEQHTVFAVDLLGYGESDRPVDSDFGILAQADYLDRALTALRVARASLVGIDLGALVAMRFAAARPERVERLVLINSPGLDEAPGDDLRAVQRGTARFFLHITRGVLGAAPLLRPVLEGSVATPDRMPDRLFARYLAPFVGRDGVGHLLTLVRSIRAQDVHEIEPEAVTAPVLVIRGERDRWVEAETAEGLVDELPMSRLVRFPDAARLVPEDDPDALLEVILPFLDGDGTL